MVYKDVKDVKNYTCYIDRLDETFQDGYERWESYKVALKTFPLKYVNIFKMNTSNQKILISGGCEKMF